jgi:hypothetical protein
MPDFPIRVQPQIDQEGKEPLFIRTLEEYCKGNGQLILTAQSLDYQAAKPAGVHHCRASAKLDFGYKRLSRPILGMRTNLALRLLFADFQ